MKAKGSLGAAKKIQELQKEWSTTIYNYETQGVAIKVKSNHNELIQIMKTRQMAIEQEKSVKQNAKKQVCRFWLSIL